MKLNTNLLLGQIPVSLFLPFYKPPLAPLAGIKFSRQLIPRCCFKCGIPTASGISSLQTATMLFLHYNASCAPIGAMECQRPFHFKNSVPQLKIRPLAFGIVEQYICRAISKREQIALARLPTNDIPPNCPQLKQVTRVPSQLQFSNSSTDHPKQNPMCP